MFTEIKDFMNYQNYGGSVLLGTSKVVVKGHGSAKAVSVEKCIEQAYKMELSGLGPKIEAELEYPGQIKVNMVRESRVVDYAK